MTTCYHARPLYRTVSVALSVVVGGFGLVAFNLLIASVVIDVPIPSSLLWTIFLTSALLSALSVLCARLTPRWSLTITPDEIFETTVWGDKQLRFDDITDLSCERSWGSAAILIRSPKVRMTVSLLSFTYADQRRVVEQLSQEFSRREQISPRNTLPAWLATQPRKGANLRFLGVVVLLTAGLQYLSWLINPARLSVLPVFVGLMWLGNHFLLRPEFRGRAFWSRRP